MSTQALERRSGWFTFVSILLFSVAGLRIISGISYLADSNRVNNLTGGLFGSHIWVWGLWDLAIAALAFFAAYSLWNGNLFGRVVAYGWTVLVIIQSFLIMAYAPWFAFAAILLAVLVLYGLITTEGSAS
jgi:hypothetical protein